jgi:putative pre-16S rRNA nuclease
MRKAMRAAGVDLGTVRVGLAVTDDLGAMAHPRAHLDGRDRERVLSQLSQLVRSEGIDVLVVGLPRRLDGREGPEARRARRFAADLSARTRARVELFDERLSTRQAARLLSGAGHSEKARRSRIDSASAALLLQAWLDGQKSSG